MRLFLFLLSFLIVGFGQPAWLPWAAPLAAAMGYALCWSVLRSVPSARLQFWTGTLWFVLVQAIQLSWMTSIEFQGLYILAVYAFLSFALGLQFGLFSVSVCQKTLWNLPKIFALAGFWTLLEWIRFHILCGFSWNIVGLSLASFPAGMQLAAWVGTLGLSFWVITTNLLALYAQQRLFVPKALVLWGFFALLPYAYGTFVLASNSHLEKKYPSFRALLVQPGLLPSQKIPIHGRQEEFISPWSQWKAICQFLHEQREKKAELIALPESAVPFRMGQAVYDYKAARELLVGEFGKEALKSFPDLIPPFSKEGKVSNAFFCQFLANYFHADFIIGLDDEEGDDYYTAAIHFAPWGDKINRYEKRVLVPLAEYLPFAWCAPLTKAYGIESFYTQGKEAKVFSCGVPVAVSICYEETFPDLMREGRLKGASAFVNITNDNWYPNSKLPRQHFDHAKLRAVENGVPMLRACNSGVTSGLDSFGRVCGQFEKNQGALFVEVPKFQRQTLYTLFGDSLIVGISLGFIVFYLLYRVVAKREKEVNNEND